MSIVNLSSEKKSQGNDADWVTRLKKPLMRVIGMQVLNVTVPLTYDIINKENDTLLIDGDVHGLISVKIPWGTYEPNDLAWITTKQLQIAESTHHSDNGAGVILSRDQFDLHQSIGLHEIPIKSNTTGDTNYGPDGISISNVKVGYVVKNNSSDEYSRVIEIFQKNNGTYKWILMKTDQTVADAEDTLLGNSSYSIINRYGLVIYNEVRSLFQISHGHHEVSMNENNTERMCRTFGIKAGELAKVTARWTTSVNNVVSQNALIALGIEANVGGIGTMPGFTVFGTETPELQGPSVIFLRIGGDILLDQQNNETNNNDRIPIPLDQPHGSIVHYNGTAQSDVIPFSVPCDVSTIKLRFEYGDDGGTVGGDTNNFKGHYTYARLKFFVSKGGGKQGHIGHGHQ